MPSKVFSPRKLILPPSPLAWLAGCWLNRDRIAQAFQAQRQDRPGLAVHLLGGLVLCFTLSFPYTVHEFVLPVVASASFIRITMTWRLLTHLLRQPIVLIALLWLGFRALSLSWTPDLEFGLIHLSEARFMLLLLALWPIMEYRTLLIGAYLAGMFVGNGVQLAEFVGLQTGWQWLIWEEHAPGRITGWWRPAFGGASLCVPLAIWLHTAFIARGNTPNLKRLAIAMSAITLAAIIASGTRSAWLASAGAIALVLAVVALRFWRAYRQRPEHVPADETESPSTDEFRGSRLPTLAVIGGIIVVVGVVALAPKAINRASSAYDEIARAVRERDYDSDTGARLLMWIEARRAFTQHPIAGLGEGGYRAWARQDALAIVEPEVAKRIQQHAHGTIPHIAATSGVIGLGFFILLFASALRCAWIAPRHGPTGLERSLLLAIIALVMVGQFETMHVGSRLKQHMWLLLALTPAYVPRQRILAPDEPGDSP